MQRAGGSFGAASNIVGKESDRRQGDWFPSNTVGRESDRPLTPQSGRLVSL